MATFRVRVPDEYAAIVEAELKKDFGDRWGFSVTREKDTGPAAEPGANPDFDRVMGRPPAPADPPAGVTAVQVDATLVIPAWFVRGRPPGMTDAEARAVKESAEPVHGFDWKAMRDRLEKAAAFAHHAFHLHEPAEAWENLEPGTRQRWRQAADAALMFAAAGEAKKDGQA